MRKTIEAAVILVLSIAITAGIMVILIPKHARGGGHDADNSPELEPAVFLRGTHDRPGTSMSPKTPKPTRQAQRGGCPYLQMLIAASACPATPESTATISCPYLMRTNPQLIEEQKQEKVRSGQSV